MTERKPFADALGDLLAEYADIDPETLITELELQARGLSEELLHVDGEQGKDRS